MEGGRGGRDGGREGGRLGREGGRGREGEKGEGGREGRGREGGREVEGGREGEGGRDDCYTYSNSDTTNPLSFPPQYLNSNVTYYVITCNSAFEWVCAGQLHVLRPT